MRIISRQSDKRRSAQRTSSRNPAMIRILAPILTGNVLEWYDIAIYTYLAVYISKAYFPPEEESGSLLMTFGLFFIGYLVRPFGALILGTYADRAGRKPALTLTLLLMGIGSVIIAFTPSYQTIGFFAPAIILLARMLQGLAAGGEYGTATTLLVEHFPQRAGFIASFQYASQGLSNILASLTGFTLAATLSANEISEWGFRIAFLIGGLVGFLAIYVRRAMPESPVFLAGKSQALRQSVWSPAFKLLRHHLGTLLLLIMVQSLSASMNYTISFVPTYAIDSFSLPATLGFGAAILGGFLQIIFYPISGRIADRFGKLNQMVTGAVIIAVVSLPLFSLVSSMASSLGILLVMVVLQFTFAWFAGPLSAVLSLSFPAEQRSIGTSFAFNTGVAIFGGITPAMVTFLIAETGQNSAPSYWLIFTAVIALIGLSVLLKRFGKHVSRPREAKADAPAPYMQK